MSTFQVQLPSGDDPTYEVYLMVEIRDEHDCLTTYNLSSSIAVQPDWSEMNGFIKSVQNVSNLEIVDSSFAQALGSENQNVVGQVITLLSNEFNRISDENMMKAVSSELLSHN